MKKYLLLVMSLLMLGACSTPKYAYNFDYHDYNSGKKNIESKNEATSVVMAQQKEEAYLLTADPSTLVASSKSDAFFPAEAKTSTEVTRAQVEEKLNSMSKEEKKEFRSKIKSFIKESKKSEVSSVQAKAGLGGDVKLAAIFGAVGIVLLIIGGDVLSIIGAVALLVGLYFFIRWLIHQ